jgi:hypothetical protein
MKKPSQNSANSNPNPIWETQQKSGVRRGAASGVFPAPLERAVIVGDGGAHNV